MTDAVENFPKPHEPLTARRGFAWLSPAVLLLLILACSFTAFIFFQRQRQNERSPLREQLTANARLESVPIEDRLNRRANEAVQSLGPLRRSFSGWRGLVVATVDPAEALALLRAASGPLILVNVLLICVAILAGALIWENRVRRLSRKQAAARKQLADTLQQQVDRLRDFASVTSEGVTIAENGRLVDVNEQYLRMTGYERDELLGKEVESPAMQAGLAAEPEVTTAEPETLCEARIRRKDGTEVDVEVRVCLGSRAGRNVRVSVVRDVTERKKQEREWRRLNRLYEMRSKVNRAIVGAGDRPELLQSVCAAALDGGFAMAWIGWCNAQAGTVAIAAAAGNTDGYLDRLKIVLDGQPDSGGVMAMVISTGRWVISNDFLLESRLKAWHELAAAKGFNAVGSFPLRLGGAVCAALTVYAYERDFFQPPEIELLNQLSDDLSLALDRLDREAGRRHQEIELRESVAWLQQAQRAAQVGSYALDIQTGDWVGSEVLDQILGLEKSFQKVEGSWQRIVHPEDWLGFKAYLKEVCAQNKRFDRDFRIIRRVDEQERWVSGKGALFFDGSSKGIRLHGIIQDITERKRAEQAIRSSRARLMEIIERTPAGYFLIDLDGRFQHVNPAWLAMHGFASLDEVIGRPMGMTLFDEDRPALEAKFARVMAARAKDTGKMRRRLADGAAACQFYSVAAVFQGNQTIGLEGFLIDVAEPEHGCGSKSSRTGD